MKTGSPASNQLQAEACILTRSMLNNTRASRYTISSNTMSIIDARMIKGVAKSKDL